MQNVSPDKTTTIRLRPEQYETLRQIAFDERVSIAELIRDAIDGWLAKRETGS